MAVVIMSTFAIWCDRYFYDLSSVQQAVMAATSFRTVALVIVYDNKSTLVRKAL